MAEIFDIVIIGFNNLINEIVTHLRFFLVLRLTAPNKIFHDGMLQMADGITGLVESVVIHDVVYQLLIKQECLVVTERSWLKTRFVLS